MEEIVIDFIKLEYKKPDHWIYDIETYPNFFCVAFENTQTGLKMFYEISTRINQLNNLLLFLKYCQIEKHTFIGFNSLSFDYPVIHYIIVNHNRTTLDDIYEKAQSIINTPWSLRFSTIVKQPLIRQIDLQKIHHFDNTAKMTGLKTLEINMGMDSVEELPITPGTMLSNEQMNSLGKYNFHDTDATNWLFNSTLDQIELREVLSKQYKVDMTNYPDSKIGSAIFTDAFKKRGLPIKGATPRSSINFNDCILPFIQFERTEFTRILHYLKSQTVTETKGVFKDLIASVEGVDYVFGSGGIHGSVDHKSFFADDQYDAILSDVVSYYPNLAIKNTFYPEHLGPGFCEIYDELFKKRKSYHKGSPENAALKLALNSAYGNSNSEYSNLYDPQFTMKITLNGQLLLAMLIEQLIKIPSLEMIFANTDGVMYRVARTERDIAMEICGWWESITKLELEHEYYKKAFVSDVNNYILESI